MIRRGLALLSLVSAPLWANEPAPELKLLSEHPVQGMSGGNLSGMAWCGDALWAVSDREDDVLYRLDTSVSPWQAEPERFEAGPPPDSGLPWGMRMRAWLSGHVRGGHLDFEGAELRCAGQSLRRQRGACRRAAGEPGRHGGMAAPARVPGSSGPGQRHALAFQRAVRGHCSRPEGRTHVAGRRARTPRAAGDAPQAEQLAVHRRLCADGAGRASAAPRRSAIRRCRAASRPWPISTTSCSCWSPLHIGSAGAAANRTVERCWSFAAEALTEERYREPFGNAEALWIDAEGAWIGVDNNGKARGDGEKRPIVWRFAAPSGGWMARP